MKATVLIETIPAAFEMDEILYELRDHSAGLNAGRWDYIFSMIKCFRERPDMVLPDRNKVTMTVPFMRAYTELLVKTCHRRGAHAMGGMAAFIPSRKTPEINEEAIEKVRADKEREAGAGFDGTWVAHPDLVDVAMEEFARCSATSRTRSTAARRRRRFGRGAARRVSAGAEYHRRGPAQRRERRHPVHLVVASRQRRGGDLQHDGGRRDGGDLALAGVAVAPPRLSLDTGEKVTAELVRRYEEEELEKVREQVGDEFFYSEGRPRSRASCSTRSR